jgi:hypothetical protein
VELNVDHVRKVDLRIVALWRAITKIGRVCETITSIVAFWRAATNVIASSTMTGRPSANDFNSRERLRRK